MRVLTTTGPICIDLEDPGLSTATKRLVEEEVLKMLNESYARTRATLSKYSKEHHMVRKKGCVWEMRSAVSEPATHPMTAPALLPGGECTTGARNVDRR